MAATVLYQVPTQNSLQYTLNTAYNPGDTTSTFNQTLTGVIQAPGVYVVDRVDSSGNTTAAKREFFVFTGVSGQQVTGITGGQGGSTNQTHAVGAIVEFIPDVVWAQSIYNALSQLVAPSTGALDITKVTDLTSSQTLTNKTITDSTNNVMAKSLKSATTTIDVSAATAPSSGQVLTATGGSAATWQTPSAATNDGWTAIAGTTVYASTDGHTFTITMGNDQTGLIGLGDRIKLTNQAATQYFIVTAITPSLLTVYGGSNYSITNAAITLPYYSHSKAPFGFNNDRSVWSEEYSDTSTATQSSPVTGTIYNVNSASLTVPIGAWSLEYFVNFEIFNNSSSNVEIGTGLSTANNTFSDTKFQCAAQIYAITRYGSPFQKRKDIVLTSKIMYYLNSVVTVNSGTTFAIYYRGDNGNTIIRAVCAYL